MRTENRVPPLYHGATFGSTGSLMLVPYRPLMGTNTMSFFGLYPHDLTRNCVSLLCAGSPGLDLESGSGVKLHVAVVCSLGERCASLPGTASACYTPAIALYVQKATIHLIADVITHYIALTLSFESASTT